MTNTHTGDLLRQTTLDESKVHANPLRQFQLWLDEAIAAQLPEPVAMTLATATPDGQPSARIVLLRGLDERGFAFFTDFRGRKGQELSVNPRAALVFYWAPFNRQVRVEGRVEPVSAAESDAYFQSRPRGHRLAAHASHQSQVLLDRTTLERRMQEMRERYPGEAIPRPPYWGGFRVIPQAIEFWQGRENRLHDRLRYERQDDGSWRILRLSP